MRLIRLLAIGAFLGVGLSLEKPAHAEDDLILPPELRARSPAADHGAADAGVAPKASSRKDKKPPVAARAVRQDDGTVKQPQHSVKGTDDPLSVGVQWNASNQPNYGAATTSGLVNEVNKNLNGQPVGSGGQVGFKYKF